MRTPVPYAWSILLIAAVGSGCGGAEPSSSAATTPTQGSDTGRRSAADDGLAVSGLLGTLSQRDINRGLDPRMGRFLDCYGGRASEVEVLSGRIEMSFRVKTDGGVRWVHAKKSTLGDREVETCLLEVARGTTFPRPRGGEAEFSFPLEFDPPDDVRPAVDLDDTGMAEILAEKLPELQEACGSVGGITVTAYVAPGGTVMTAGAYRALAEPEAETESLDCVATNIRTWTLPDPGSYTGKLSFDLP